MIRKKIEQGPDDSGSNAAVAVIFLMALVVILAILLYGLALGHWFTFGGTVPSISPSS